jgi:hypothetical protein
MRRRLLHLALVVVSISVACALAEPELKQPNWSKAWSYHPADLNWPEHRLTVNGAARNGDELYGDLMLTNVVEGKKIPPPVTIRRRSRREELVERSSFRSMKWLFDFLKGTWLGHPLHPILVHVPMAMWPGALIFDVLCDGKICVGVHPADEKSS